MGLDSVHLILEFEQFFGIQFQDADLEKVATVKEMVALTALQLGVSRSDDGLRASMGARLREGLASLGLSPEAVAAEDRIGELLLPHWQPEAWEQLQARLGLVLPSPIAPEPKPRWYHRLVKPRLTAPISYARWVDIVCMANFKQLIDPKTIHDSYEIYVAIGGIMAEALGVELEEVRPDATFANDFGID